MRITPPAIPEKKRMPILLACSCFSVFLVFSLYQISEKINHDPNGFIRLFPPHMTEPKRAVDLSVNSYYVAGATSKRIYLGNSMAPGALIATDYALLDTQHLQLRFPP